MKWERQLQNLMDLDNTTDAISATAQIIQCEMASKAVNYADLSQVVPDLPEVTDRVDELEKDLSQTVGNLGEETRRKRESETSVVHDRESLHGKMAKHTIGKCFW